MTELLTKAFAVASQLGAIEQDEVARVVLRLAGEVDDAPVPLSDLERTAIAASQAAAARGEFATDDDVRAVWSRYVP